jgi:hypothetical protein
LRAADFYYSFSTGLASTVFPGGDKGGGRLWRWMGLRSVCGLLG